MKTYIIGNKKNIPAFDHAERLLRQKGHIPINPVKVLYALPEDISHSDFTVIAFEMIRICDAVYLLDDWKGDLYASMEVSHAKRSEKELINDTHFI